MHILNTSGNVDKTIAAQKYTRKSEKLRRLVVKSYGVRVWIWVNARVNVRVWIKFKVRVRVGVCIRARLKTSGLNSSVLIMK